MSSSIAVLGGGVCGIAGYFAGGGGGSIELTDYYAAERAGVWFGVAGERLGLAGKIDRHEFENILLGKSPLGDDLIARRKTGIRADAKKAQKTQTKDRERGKENAAKQAGASANSKASEKTREP